MNLLPDPALTAAFATFARATDASEWGAATLVNRVIDPGVGAVSIAPLLVPVSGWADEPPWRLLEHLGFRGDDEALHNPDNSCIARVVERRRGLPITLALVLIELARARGLVAWGLNTPGHFLAYVQGEVIDPVRMLPLPIAGALPRATPVDVALRMLNNIKHACLQQRQPHSALVVIEHQLSIAQALDNAELRGALHLETGNCWLALNLPEMAREHFQACVDLLPASAEAARNAAMRLRLLGPDRAPTLH